MAPDTDGVADTTTNAGDSSAMAQIIDRARSGDVDAFETIYRAHTAAIHALCLRMSGDRAVASDLVQDVFVRAWERLPSFRGQSALATWLHRLAVNVVLERWRSEKRDALRMIDDPDGTSVEAPAMQADRDSAIEIEDAIARLSAGARAVFVLHEIEGYSHEEIAAMTGIAAGTSRTQLFRARRALAIMLKL